MNNDPSIKDTKVWLWIHLGDLYLLLQSVSKTEELCKTLSGPSSEMKEMETPIEFQCSPSLQEELYHWKSSGPQLGKKNKIKSGALLSSLSKRAVRARPHLIRPGNGLFPRPLSTDISLR